MRSLWLIVPIVSVAGVIGFYFGYAKGAHATAAFAPRPPSAPRGTEARSAVSPPDRPAALEFPSRVARFGPGPANPAQAEQLRQELEAWAAQDPGAALTYVTKHLGHDRQERLVPLLLSVWARTDPRAAWGWLSTPEAASLTFPTLADAVLSEAGKNHPVLAWSIALEAAQQRPSDAQGLYVSALRGMLYEGNFEQAVALVADAQFPKGDGRYDLTSLIASEWGRYEPEQAAAWLNTLPEGFERRQAMISLGQSWAEIDAQRAADFAAQLPPSLERASMLSAAVDRWAADHPGQVGEWLLRYQQSGDFDQIVSAVATNQRVVGQNPPLAVSWADTIVDPDVRIQSLAQVFDEWLTRDDRSAKAFLLNSDQLAPAVRDELRRRLHVND